MTERDEPHVEPGSEHPPRARVHVSEWSPWVWVLPILAVLFVGWLIVRYGYFGGGDITVRFADARGLERYSPVRYKGAKVGTVQKITIDENLEEVVLRISLDSYMRHALREDTKFWIVEPGLEGGVGSLLAGTYVAISPGSSEEIAREFVGQEYAPILRAPERGKIFVLTTDRLGSLSTGAPVYFDGVRVGRVLGAEHDRDRKQINVFTFIVERFADSVRENTRFHRMGGLSISFSGGSLSMGDSSLAALLTGGLAFYTPEVLAGEMVPDGSAFELHDSRAEAIAAADGPHLVYMTYFPGPIGGLSPGTRVQMKGVQVGRVRDVRLVYVAESASLVTPVTLEIDPRELDFEILPSTSRDELRDRVDDAIDAMVRNGLRATLATSLVFPGASAVSLEFEAAPGTGRLGLAHDPPVIPAVGADRSLESTLASINRVARKIEGLPLQEIAGHLRSAARRVDALVSDPALDESLQRLNRSLAEIERVAITAGENVGPLAESLRNAAAAAESAARRVEELVGSSVQQGYDLGELVKELTRAAEAVRELAQFLTENPDALVKGRPE
ncbi:MAG: intermembrane transport protein PqiB [Thermoanaerobaculia bacterium]